MRRFILVAALVMALGAITVGVAAANAGPHGGYTSSTSKCAQCHRAHTGPQAELLKVAGTEYEFCTSCHGGGGSALDVTLGLDGTDHLNGGSFAATLGGSGAAQTSIHKVVGATVPAGQGGTLDYAYGGVSNGYGLQGTLSCTSCHNPHGSSNYRILRDTNNGGENVGGVALTAWGNLAEANKWQDSEVLPNTSGGYTTNAPLVYNQGMNQFCASCHKQYLTDTGSGTQPSDTGAAYWYKGTQSTINGGAASARYRHAVSISIGAGTGERTPTIGMRLAYPGIATSGTANGMTCLTCHFSHGTTAQKATDGGTDIAPAQSSALLVMDNRGVCANCHQKGK